MLGPCGLDDQPPANDNLYPNDDKDDEATASAVEGTEPAVTKLTTLNKLRKGIIKIRYNVLIYSQSFIFYFETLLAVMIRASHDLWAGQRRNDLLSTGQDRDMWEMNRK